MNSMRINDYLNSRVNVKFTFVDFIENYSSKSHNSICNNSLKETESEFNCAISTNDILNIASSFIAEKDYVKGISYYKMALAKRPEMSDFFNNYALLCLSNNMIKDAVDAFEFAYDLLLQNQNFDKSLFDQASSIILNLCFVASSQGDFSLEDKYFQIAIDFIDIKLKENLFVKKYLKLNLEMRKSKHYTSLKNKLSSIKISNVNDFVELSIHFLKDFNNKILFSNLLNNIGILYSELKDIENSHRYFRFSLLINSCNIKAMNNLSMSYSCDYKNYRDSTAISILSKHLNSSYYSTDYVIGINKFNMGKEGFLSSCDSFTSSLRNNPYCLEANLMKLNLVFGGYSHYISYSEFFKEYESLVSSFDIVESKKQFFIKYFNSKQFEKRFDTRYINKNTLNLWKCLKLYKSDYVSRQSVPRADRQRDHFYLLAEPIKVNPGLDWCEESLETYLFDNAINYYLSKNYNTAIPILEFLQNLDSTNADYVYLHSLIFYEQSKFESCNNLLKIKNSICGASLQCNVLLAKSNIMLEQFENAIMLLENVKKDYDSNVEIKFLLAKCFFMIENFAESEYFSNQVVLKYPQCNHGLYGKNKEFLVKNLWKSGRYKSIIEIFDCKDDFIAENIKLTLKLANSYYKLGDLKNALKYYNSIKLEQIFKDETKIKIGKVFYKEKNYSKAITFWSEFVGAPQFKNSHVKKLAYCYFMIGDLNSSLQLYNRIKDTGVLKGKSLLNVGRIYFSMHKYSQAIQYLEQIIGEPFFEIRDLINLSESYFHVGEYLKAKETFNKVKPEHTLSKISKNINDDFIDKDPSFCISVFNQLDGGDVACELNEIDKKIDNLEVLLRSKLKTFGNINDKEKAISKSSIQKFIGVSWHALKKETKAKQTQENVDYKVKVINSKHDENYKEIIRIGYTPNDDFKQLPQQIDYPIVKMPNLNSLIKFPRKNRAGKKGVTEDYLFLILKKHFKSGFILSCNMHLPINSKSVYEPDIVLIKEKHNRNIFINIEIDEPYDGISRYPTHCLGTDDKRDDYFTNRGWIVVRFAEFQIISEPIGCVAYIAKIISSLDANYYSDLLSSDIVDAYRRWNDEMSKSWEASKYREKYLGIDSFQHTLEVDVIYNIEDSAIDDEIENQIIVANNLPQAKLQINNFGQNSIKERNPNSIAARDNRLFFNEYEHRYFIDNSVEAISVTKLIEKFFEVSNSKLWAHKKAWDYCVENQIDLSDDNIEYHEKRLLLEWKEIGENALKLGQELHKNIELYYSNLKHFCPSTEFSYF